MESIYLLIPIALLFVALGVWIFFWAVDNGQFDDLEGPAHSILFDEELPQKPSSGDQSQEQKNPTSENPTTESPKHGD
ncbi:cbb3-type cytochrome oxidase assembly protein CcoS [Aestuariirhabdus litorea]|uniref:Cbb3-type cytochrome oxidase assembly protein CcoS n=1 Tax=Aestuariirhabdus litorea TaxID=2528527 RepID=A0A3P3VRY1_9GAMM|nr:cbb3-type cytochrome oxidase assembly protein CcoS [Aestuariirhabdus litorea]RRJ84456.1 cbb3-type cytochrome oxidase assembly protein CcoS [Aestuariirhabdus litorea]RWW97680.1 cbb3-type cytochrome oxidase assembly protein CcoS [Endozoicomonadaceae bacterium GTF-13]